MIHRVNKYQQSRRGTIKHRAVLTAIIASTVIAGCTSPVQHKNTSPLADVDWATVMRSDMGCSLPIGEPWAIVIPDVVAARDVNADGVQDAVVVSACPTTTAGNPIVAYVYDGASDISRPKLIGKLGSNQYFKDLEVSIASDASIVISGPALSVNDPRCCPSLYIEQRYHWQAGAFYKIDEKVRLV